MLLLESTEAKGSSCSGACWPATDHHGAQVAPERPSGELHVPPTSLAGPWLCRCAQLATCRGLCCGWSHRVVSAAGQHPKPERFGTASVEHTHRTRGAALPTPPPAGPGLQQQTCPLPGAGQDPLLRLKLVLQQL